MDIVGADNPKEVEKTAMIIRGCGHSTTETLLATPWQEFLPSAPPGRSKVSITPPQLCPGLLALLGGHPLPALLEPAKSNYFWNSCSLAAVSTVGSAMGQPKASRALALCVVFLIAALYVVGVVSHGVLRHVVQTAPMWPTVVLGLRDSRWAKWTALPCFCCWLLLMGLIWLFLLGWAHVISGTFSPIELAMTFVVGASSIFGLVTGLRMRSGTSAARAAVVCLLTLAVQVLALKVSFLPGIAHD
ncbi:MAG TPA: hypothetical protein VG206_25175 [Terriglobia bacterium]|nr:hypothetical protein [Terriglobia bacterium]